MVEQVNSTEYAESHFWRRNKHGAEKEPKEERKKREVKKGQEGKEATEQGGVAHEWRDYLYQRTGWEKNKDEERVNSRIW